MHDILTHGGFGIAGRPLACGVVSAEVRIKRYAVVRCG